jgi:hypothetical protein
MRMILRSREICFFARAGQTAGSSTSRGMTEHGVVTIFYSASAYLTAPVPPRERETCQLLVPKTARQK